MHSGKAQAHGSESRGARIGVRVSARERLGTLHPAAALINGNIRISGDTAPLLALRKILADLDIDWEQPLADSFGDVAAHQIGTGLRAGHRWLNATRQNLHRQFEEFLVEESNLVPHPCQADDFYQQIDDVKARSERLEAKLRRLQARLTPQTNKN